MAQLPVFIKVLSEDIDKVRSLSRYGTLYTWLLGSRVSLGVRRSSRVRRPSSGPRRRPARLERALGSRRGF